MTLIATAGSPPSLIAGTAVFAVGNALAFPALLSLAMRHAAPAERGSVVGTFTAFLDLAFLLGAVSLGAVAAHVGYAGSFLGAAAVALTGLVVLLAPLGRLEESLRKGR
jgi:predicted MFS family arabinose efflux permease